MAKVVIGYQKSMVRWHDGMGLHQRLGYFPIFKQLGKKPLTTMDSELPSMMSLEAYQNIWPHANTGKERR